MRVSGRIYNKYVVTLPQIWYTFCVETQTKIFGSVRRTEVLVALALLEETYPSELAHVLDIPLMTVQRILDDLEREDVVVKRTVGRNRMASLNPRLYGVAELRGFLMKYALRTDIVDRLAKLRRRPRRTGKEV
jgi:DNA-binding transcriptional ArsR family regulator